MEHEQDEMPFTYYDMACSEHEYLEFLIKDGELILMDIMGFEFGKLPAGKWEHKDLDKAIDKVLPKLK